MRPQKVDDQQLMSGLLAVLRAKGFEGASLNDLATATGLKKASLYHRFPGGKEEIAKAVLSFVKSWNHQHVLMVLTDEKKSVKERLDKVIKNIERLYDNGKSVCILRALSTDAGIPIFGIQIKESFGIWMKAFTALGVSKGFIPEKSEQMAKEVIIKVQGSLILAKGINDYAVFRNALMNIKEMYL